MLERLSLKLNNALPIYIPKSRRFTDECHIAIWNCGDCKNHKSLWRTLKDIRITLRKNHKAILVIKKGDV
jgi:hypothetical protein